MIKVNEETLSKTTRQQETSVKSIQPKCVCTTADSDKVKYPTNIYLTEYNRHYLFTTIRIRFLGLLSQK